MAETCQRCTEVELRHYDPNRDVWDVENIINHAWIMACPQCNLVYRVYGKIGDDGVSTREQVEEGIAEAFRRVIKFIENNAPNQMDEASMGVGLMLAAIEEVFEFEGLATRLGEGVWKKGKN